MGSDDDESVDADAAGCDGAAAAGEAESGGGLFSGEAGDGAGYAARRVDEVSE